MKIVKDIMRHQTLTLFPQDRINVVTEKMKEHDVGVIVVSKIRAV